MKKILGSTLGLALAGFVLLLVGGIIALAIGVGATTSATVASLGVLYGSVKKECVVGAEDGTPVTGSQASYVRTMIGVAKTMNVPKKGMVIATMVMLQESGIQNYANSGKNIRGFGIDQFWLDAAKLSLKYDHDAVGNDADSVGLFQQRASAGWADDGSFKARQDPKNAIRRLLDPRWSAQQFFGGSGGSPNRGLRDLKGWQGMDMTVASQKVQGSAFPEAYRKWESKAEKLVNASYDAPAVALLSGKGAGSASTSTSNSDSGSSADSGSDSKTSSVGYPIAKGKYTLTSGFGPRPGNVGGSSNFHGGQDFAAPLGTPIMAVADGKVVATGAAGGYGQWIVLDHKIDGKLTSSLYAHMFPNGVLVSKGDTVSKGDVIAKVGNNGNTTGAHLHLEIWPGGRIEVGGKHVPPIPWLKGNHAVSGVGGGSGGEDADCKDSEDSAGSSATGSAAAMISAGKKWLGTPYSWGGGSLTGPSEGFAQGAGIKGFDCSSLVRYMIWNGTGGKNGGMEIPRVASAQYSATSKKKVGKSDLQPGDLLFWGGSAGSIHHVAMYVGDNKMIEAPRTGGVVQVVPARLGGDYFAATRPNIK